LFVFFTNWALLGSLSWLVADLKKGGPLEALVCLNTSLLSLNRFTKHSQVIVAGVENKVKSQKQSSFPRVHGWCFL